MAQSFTSYNPIQLGQGTANVFEPDNQKWGQILASELNKQDIAKARLAKAQQGTEPKPESWNPNYKEHYGTHSNVISSMLPKIGESFNRYSQANGGMNKGNKQSYINKYNPLVEQFNNLGLATTENRKFADNLYKTKLESGDVADALMIKAYEENERKEGEKFLESNRDEQDPDAYISKGIAYTQQKVQDQANALRQLSGKNIPLGQLPQVIKTFTPVKDITGYTNVETIPNGDGTYSVKTDGRQVAKINNQDIEAGRNQVVNSGVLRRSQANDYLTTINSDNPKDIASGYLKIMEERGFKPEKIKIEYDKLEELSKNGELNLKNVLGVVMNGELVKYDLAKKYDATIGFKDITTNKSTIQSVGKGGGGAGSGKPTAVAGWVSDQDVTPVNGKDVAYNKHGGWAVTLNKPLSVNGNISVFNNDGDPIVLNEQGKQISATQAVVRFLTPNKRLVINEPQNFDDENQHVDFEKAFNSYINGDKRFAKNTYKIDGKKYTLDVIAKTPNLVKPHILPTIVENVAQNEPNANDEVISGKKGVSYISNNTDLGMQALERAKQENPKTYQQTIDIFNKYKSYTNKAGKTLLNVKKATNSLPATKKIEVDSTKLIPFQ